MSLQEKRGAPTDRGRAKLARAIVRCGELDRGTGADASNYLIARGANPAAKTSEGRSWSEVRVEWQQQAARYRQWVADSEAQWQALNREMAADEERERRERGPSESPAAQLYETLRESTQRPASNPVDDTSFQQRMARIANGSSAGAAEARLTSNDRPAASPPRDAEEPTDDSNEGAATARRQEQEQEQQVAQRKAEREAQAEAERTAAEEARRAYLASMRQGIRLRAIECEGKHQVVGTKPAGRTTCINVSYRATCPNGIGAQSGIAYNFAGTSSCYGDTHLIGEKLPCSVDQIAVTVTDVQFGCE